MKTTEIRITPAELVLLRKMESEILREGEKVERHPILFHYTTPIGFQSIVQSRQIWATHFRYLNDTSELVHGEDIVQEEAERLVAVMTVPSPQRSFLSQFITDFPEKRLSESIGVYVASFSEEGDHLPQWRGYGDNGAGYSIGLGPLPLPDGDAPDPDAGMSLYRCIYDTDGFRARARKLLIDAGKIFGKYILAHAKPEQAGHPFLDTAMGAIYTNVAREVLCLKHDAFKEEREWRLVVLAARDGEKKIVKFRSGTAGLVPHIPIPLGIKGDESRVDIRRVFVGPGRNSLLASNAARMLLSFSGYDGDALVMSSKVPYRRAG